MQLTFNEAVDYLKGMFPAWDRDALSQILSANEGRMGRTIDEILNLDSKNAGIHEVKGPTRIQSMRAKRPSYSPKKLAEAVSPRNSPRKANPNFRSRVENSVVYRGVKFILPPSFLTLAQDTSGLAQKKKRRSVIDDDKLAHLLKNEMFRQRLEAYGYSFRPGEGPESAQAPQEAAPEQVELQRATSQSSIPVDEANAAKTVSSLGETTKRNLSMLAFRFIHGVDEMAPLEDGKHTEFDFDDVYEKDEAQSLDESFKSFKMSQSSKS